MEFVIGFAGAPNAPKSARQRKWTMDREICKTCGQPGRWCSVYTGCPLNKGKAHDMKRVCITVKGKLFKHQFVYDGVGDGRHCIFCQDPEGENGSKSPA